MNTNQPTILQECASQLFFNMDLENLATNHPYQTMAGYAETGEFESNGDNFTEIQWEWEKAVEREVLKADKAGRGWIVCKKHLYSDAYRYTFVCADDEATLQWLRKEEWEMAGYYQNAAAWAETRKISTVVLACFYAHNFLDRYTELTGHFSIDLLDIANAE